MRHSHHSTQQSGFTMVVIAALFIAFAVIAAAAVERNTTVQQITRRDATVAQLQRLSNAIIEYSVFNKSGTTLLYPCPARTDITQTTAGFGDVTVNCYNTTTAGTALYGTEVIVGMVPVTTLSQYGIGANDAFDPWNNRIMYAVNRTLTPSGTPAQTNNPTLADKRTGFDPASPALGADTTGSEMIIKPDFILFSYGRDGVGAVKRDSTTVSIACTNATSTLRFENCDTDDAAFFIAPYNISATATGTTYFDDILTWYRQ